MKSRVRVASLPSKPVVIYDGDCGFCRDWVRRGQTILGNRVEFWPFQDARLPRHFPELPLADCERSAQLIETDGAIYSGAEAVFRALAHNVDWGGWRKWYDRLPWFARLAEWAYAFVARHRQFFSRLMR